MKLGYKCYSYDRFKYYYLIIKLSSGLLQIGPVMFSLKEVKDTLLANGVDINDLSKQHVGEVWL